MAFATPTGLRPPAQGCRTRLPWDPDNERYLRNPNGVASHSPRLPYSATLGTAKMSDGIRNPNGVASPSPRLPYSATLGSRQRAISSQPQRGCVPQPKVAVLGYPGNRENERWHSQPQRGCVPQPKVAVLGYLGIPTTSDIFATPTGLRPTAQGCRTRLPWEPRK